jgi:concanavalin A-like lectin/glucanase superfamily protein
MRRSNDGLMRRAAVMGILAVHFGGCAKDRFGDLDEQAAPAATTPTTPQPSPTVPSTPEPVAPSAAPAGEGGPPVSSPPASDVSATSAGCDLGDEACTCPDAGATGCAEVPCTPGTAGCGPQCSGCLVMGACIAANTVNSLNACLVCDPARNVADWSANDGATCDDGQFCTVGDVCQGGACASTPRVCEDGIACNGVSSCDEAVAACSAPGNLCGAGAVCDTTLDMCVTTCLGCLVDGNCVGNGAEQAGNPCMVCDTSRSTTTYVAAIGKACGAGTSACSQQDTCDATGACLANELPQGTPCGNSTSGPCDGADSCDGSGNCLQRTAANGTACDDGQFCTINDACQGGGCVGAARSCGVGLICDETADVCQCAGCQINGGCLASGSVSAANPCQVCDPTRSTLTFSASLDPLCPAQGLVAYFPFDGNADDASGGGNDCSVTGATPAPDRLGRADRALHFDGANDRVVCEGQGSVAVTGALSVAAWFSAEAPSLTGGNRALITKGQFSGAGMQALRSYSLVIQNQDQSAQGLCGATNSAAFAVSADGVASTPNGTSCGVVGFAPDVWHHVVGVFQPGTRMALYVDGQLANENTSDVASGIFNSEPPLSIGVNGTNLYQGSLDEIRIYNRALSQAEISAIFSSAQ